MSELFKEIKDEILTISYNRYCTCKRYTSCPTCAFTSEILDWLDRKEDNMLPECCQQIHKMMTEHINSLQLQIKILVQERDQREEQMKKASELITRFAVDNLVEDDEIEEVNNIINCLKVG